MANGSVRLHHNLVLANHQRAPRQLCQNPCSPRLVSETHIGISVPILMFIPPKMPRFCTIPAYCIHHIKSMTLCKIHLVTRLNETQLKGSHAVATLGVAKKVLQEGRGVVPVQELKGLPVTSFTWSLSWRSRIRELKPTFSLAFMVDTSTVQWVYFPKLDLAGLIFSDLWCLVPDIPNVRTENPKCVSWGVDKPPDPGRSQFAKWR